MKKVFVGYKEQVLSDINEYLTTVIRNEYRTQEIIIEVLGDDKD